MVESKFRFIVRQDITEYRAIVLAGAVIPLSDALSIKFADSGVSIEDGQFCARYDLTHGKIVTHLEVNGGILGIEVSSHTNGN